MGFNSAPRIASIVLVLVMVKTCLCVYPVTFSSSEYGGRGRGSYRGGYNQQGITLTGCYKIVRPW